MTPKQTAFVDEYLIDLNATQAAIRAGYSEKTAGAVGHENLKKPEIEKALAARIAARSNRTDITQDLVLTDIELIKRDAMRESLGKDGKAAMVNHFAALKACELQGKHLGMFGDKLALTIESTPDEELDGRIAELLRKTGISAPAC